MAALSEQWLECLVCRGRQEFGPALAGCPRCSAEGRRAPLEVRYDYSRIDPSPCCIQGIWQWGALLPRFKEQFRITLGEGNTPLVPVRAAGPRLLLKNETMNPTWSYKDRANCVSVSAAAAFGFRSVFASSTGNHGNAVAAYATAAGLRSLVFCHSEAPDLQLALMRRYGARIVRGGSQAALGRALVASGEWFPCSILCPRDGYANPFGVEGFKTIAFEIVRQLGGKPPDRVYAPVGSGDGFYGLWKGFVEMKETGVVDRLPRMFACQASGANPYVRAFRNGARAVGAVPSARTVALSIAERIGGDAALNAVYASGGGAVEVGDEEITEAGRALARQGLAVEPASATAAACAWNDAGPELEGETWVAIGTGATVKWPQSVCAGFVRPAELPPDFDDAAQLLMEEAEDDPS